MANKQIKVFKERFDWWCQRLQDVYMGMADTPIIDKVLTLYEDIDETLYTEWVKAFKLLFNPLKKEKDCYIFNKDQFQNFVNISIALHQAFKAALDAKSMEDTVMLNEGWVNVVDFTNQYINYLKQCLAGKTSIDGTFKELKFNKRGKK